jgi:hypothetical protein
MRLALSDVALRFSPEVGIDAIDGAVELIGGDWSVRDLRLRGDATDATLDASLVAGHLRGELRGANLDLDFVRALYDEISAFRAESEDEEAPSPISGDLAVRLDRVGFGRSETTKVRADVAFADGDVAVRDLALDTYEGKVTGRADFEGRGAAPSLLRLDLELAGVRGRFLDDAFFEPKRDIKGRYDATIHFEAPLAGEAQAMMADADGTLDVRGTDGSFGKLGLATKLITVLRSTEALRAKLPAMQDEGLVFDSAVFEIAMERGVATVKTIDIDSHVYAIDGHGTLDFRTEKSRVPLEVNIIRGLSGVVEWIPVAGNALQILNVRMTASGSPWDLQIGVASFKDQLLGAGRAGMGAVVGDASDALRILRGIGGAKPGAPDAEPAPDAGPEEPEETPAERALPEPALPEPALSEQAEPIEPVEPVAPSSDEGTPTEGGDDDPEPPPGDAL